MNYSELVAQLQTWVESSEVDFVGEMDNFIVNAEHRIYKAIDFAITRDEDTSVTVAQGTATITLPADTLTVRFVQLVSAGTGARTTLYHKDTSFIDEYTNNRTTQGTPKFYSFANETTLLLGPTPDNSTDTLAIHRSVRPAPLSATNTTTWLADTYPELLLYSCLLEIATFHKYEPDTMQDYQGKYQEALQSVLVEENHRNRFDRARHGEIGIQI